MPDTLETEAIKLAARLVRNAPDIDGNPKPTWLELNRLAELMKDGAMMIRKLIDERKDETKKGR